MSRLDDCKSIQLDRYTSNRRGSLTPVQSEEKIPFDIKRIYYLYDIPSNSKRGGHAHHDLEQLIIAVSGSFDLVLNDSFNEKIINLNNPSIGIYLPKLIWRELQNFSSGATCLVLASKNYEEADYIREFNSFIEIARIN
tara:strand:+ start:2373 stop:2789 length:417 start_codon:yes stop_codon:yes gene_type:complete